MKLGKGVTLIQPRQQLGDGLGVIEQVVDDNIHLAFHAIIHLLQLAGHTFQPAQPVSGLGK
ncbi:Uncharacterised protein [Shigella flexneri]|nr:Uncharacterised protein [Shigella sonnei]SRN39547.1 Uncharacterised protein [Shigella flexneri]